MSKGSYGTSMHLVTIKRSKQVMVAGKRTRAMCPKCHAWIKPGERFREAAGRGRVFAHVKCPRPP